MKNTFENNKASGIEKKEIIEKALFLSREIIKRTQIKEADFQELYGKEEIERDSNYVEKRTNDFKNSNQENSENAKLGEIFEAITAVAREWFGKNTQTIKTSRYDDIANGIDLIAELSKDEEGIFVGEIGLAIDVTFSNEFEDKLEKIRKEIDEDRLPKIKYFESKKRKIKGQLSDVVRVVITASKETVLELSETLISATKNPKILFENQFQFQALEEIIIQLKTYQRYAQSLGRKDLAERFQKALSLMLYVKKERTQTIEDKKERDSAFDKLESYLSSDFQTSIN